jgi:hypothetical protein
MFLSRAVARWTSLTQFSGDAYLQSMMGHGLKASSQNELVEKLKSRGFLNGVPDVVYTAFADTDRARFLPPGAKDVYLNTPQSIGTHFMSTPQLHAQIISLLSSRLGLGRLACEIGAGTGYLPAVFAKSKCSRVYAVEKDLDLLSKCRINLEQDDNVVVAETLPQDNVVDALYVSPYFDSFNDLESFIETVRLSQDAIVVASILDEQSITGPIKDQQLLSLERDDGVWTKTPLFRTLCEPLVR